MSVSPMIMHSSWHYVLQTWQAHLPTARGSVARLPVQAISALGLGNHARKGAHRLRTAHRALQGIVRYVRFWRGVLASDR